jgi:hypothetical protein
VNLNEYRVTAVGGKVDACLEPGIECVGDFKARLHEIKATSLSAVVVGKAMIEPSKHQIAIRISTTASGVWPSGSLWMH